MTNTTDARSRLRYFEVHYWPATGRIVMIHAEPMYGTGEPIVTHVQIIGTAGTSAMADTTMLTASALNAYANPRGEVFEHTGTDVWQIDQDNCSARIRVPSGSARVL